MEYSLNESDIPETVQSLRISLFKVANIVSNVSIKVVLTNNTHTFEGLACSV